MAEISYIAPLKRPYTEYGTQVRETLNNQSFHQTLTDVIHDANRLQLEKDSAVTNFITGQSEEIHQTMIAIQKADISFKLMTAVINRARRAYEEIRNMQI